MAIRSAGPPLFEPFSIASDLQRALPQSQPGIEWIRFMTDVQKKVDDAVSLKKGVALTTQGAAIATTAIQAGTLVPGLYRVTYYARITRAATVSSSLTVTIGWTDGAIALTQAGAAIVGNTTSTVQGGTMLVRIDNATDITYAAAYASVGATTMQFRLNVAVELVAAE